MAKINLITGGFSSGKSRWAASFFASCDNVLYMCVPEEMDQDILRRINWNNEHNYLEWTIKTNFKDLEDPEIMKHKFIIFDSLAIYTLKKMRAMCPDPDTMTSELKKEIQAKVIAEVSSLIERVKESDGIMVIITSETGFSVQPDNLSQRYFCDILGGVNQRIANIASEVYMSVSGIQYRIK